MTKDYGLLSDLLAYSDTLEINFKAGIFILNVLNILRDIYYLKNPCNFSEVSFFFLFKKDIAIIRHNKHTFT